MALWDLLKQAPIAAIGRAVQGYFQPQQQAPQQTSSGNSSGLIPMSSESNPQAQNYRPPMSSETNPAAQNYHPPASSGGGGQSGGGGGEQPPYAPNVVNQTVSYGGRTWKGNPGSGWTMVGESSPQSQAPQAPAAPPKFDMGAFSRKMQDMASSASQKFSAGLGAAGEAVKTGGSNLMSAIGRSVQPMPNFKVGAADENAPETKKPASFTNPVEGTWFGGKGLFADRGWTEKLFGGKGSMEPTNLYNPKAAQVGQIGEKMGMTQAPLPATPPALGGGGGGAGSVLGLSDVTFASLIDEIMSPSSFAQAAQMPMEDLDAAYTQMANELGVTKQQAVLNDLNTQVLEVTDSLESIDKDVTAEAGDVLMTEGQRRRLVEARSRPLREQLVKLMRSAQYAGVGLDNLMGMLKDRMSAKQQTVTNQFQASQQAQNAEEERKRRLMGLLPYVQPKAKAVSSGGGGGSGGGDIFEQAKALGLEV